MLKSLRLWQFTFSYEKYNTWFPSKNFLPYQGMIQNIVVPFDIVAFSLAKI